MAYMMFYYTVIVIGNCFGNIWGQMPLVHLIGNSMGGFICAEFASRYPDRSLSVALFNPAGVLSPEPSRMQLLLAAGRNPFLVEDREQFIEFYAMTMATPPLMPNMVLTAIADHYQARRSQLQKMFSDFIHSPLLETQLATLSALHYFAGVIKISCCI